MAAATAPDTGATTQGETGRAGSASGLTETVSGCGSASGGATPGDASLASVADSFAASLAASAVSSAFGGSLETSVA